MSCDWFSALRGPPLWALFQAGSVFKNINCKLFCLFSTPLIFGEAYAGSPELTTAGALVSD